MSEVCLIEYLPYLVDRVTRDLFENITKDYCSSTEDSRTSQRVHEILVVYLEDQLFVSVDDEPVKLDNIDFVIYCVFDRFLEKMFYQHFLPKKKTLL